MAGACWCAAALAPAVAEGGGVVDSLAPADDRNARTNGGAVGNAQAPRWPSAAAAYAWAVESGACANEFEAQGSMKKIVAAQFDGRLTKENMADAMEAFHARQMEKLHEMAEAAVQDAPEVDPEGAFN